MDYQPRIPGRGSPTAQATPRTSLNVGFSLNSDGGVVVQQGQAAGGSSTTFNGGASGGSQSSGGIAQGGTDINAFANAERAQGVLGSGISIDSFNKLTQGMIQPYIDRAKKEQYAEGMSEAAQGKSLIQIENDQPWYTKIYGPDATVQGAQMFNVNAAMNDAQTQFMKEMPQLRERPPDQVRQYLVNKMGEVKPSGDQYTDAMVQQKLAEQLPQMLDQHMQQYVQYTQEQNYLGFTNMGTSAARSMQATMSASPNLTDDDIKKNYANYGATLAKPDNMTTEAYQRGLRDITVSNAMTGNWQAVRAIKQMPEFQQIDPQLRADLDDKIPLLEAQAAAKNPAYANDMSSAESLTFNVTRGYNPYPATPAGHAALIEKMNDVNAAYKLQYGDATVPFTPEKQQQMLLQNDENAQRIYIRAQKSQQEHLNYNKAATWVYGAFASNTPGALKGFPIPEGAKVTALNSLYDNAVISGPDSASYTAFWSHAGATAAKDSSFIVPKVKNMIDSTTGTMFDTNGPMTKQQMAVIDMARELRNSPGGVQAVKAYFGDSAEPVLAILDSGANVEDPKQFDMIRQQVTRARFAVPSVQDKQSAMNYVSSQDPAWWKHAVGLSGSLSNWQISDGAKRNLSTDVASAMAQKQRAFGLSDDDAAKAAFQQVMGDRILVPGAVVNGDSGKWGNQDNWFSNVARVPGALADQGSTAYHDAMQSYIADLATDALEKRPGFDANHFDASDYTAQYGTYLGGGQMSLYLTNGDGAPLQVTLNAQDFGKRVAKTVLHHSYGNKKHLAPGDVSDRNAWGWGY